MNGEKRLPPTAGGFLIVVGALADGAKILLTLFYDIGAVVNPFFISPVAWVIFYIVLDHNGLSMLSGKASGAGWTNLIIAETPEIDIVPDWTIYAIYLNRTYGSRSKKAGFEGGEAVILQ